MKITSITPQQRDENRVNIFVDGVYALSLDIAQVTDLRIRVGADYSADDMAQLEKESEYGKLYSLALAYCMLRPHSSKEVQDYLHRKTLNKYTPRGLQKGVSADVADRVYDRLKQRGYIDDDRFAAQWVESRKRSKGVSMRSLASELASKGVSVDIIEHVLRETDRSDLGELKKIIAKKAARYSDPTKLIQYLQRQGFAYADICRAMTDED